ncbi:MAG: Alpha-amylase [Anaerolineales bacterium]|nr:Alpha-amylase [Anaerolineales bacterium]
MKNFLACILLNAILLGCTTPLSTPEPDSVPAAESSSQAGSTAWWREAVFYEIFVRSFYDSSGDGIGDFNGITQKLDYIESLGVNAIWLMPIQPSPSYHGYDVTDYYSVNPEYGTVDDFKNLLAEAHERDIKIIVDLVLNHTSSQHPFFVDANSGPDSPHRDWYLWSNESGERWHQGNDGFYYGYFWEGMPDLNYLNPDITAEMFEATRFWLGDIGIDGFRLDAAKHLIEENGKLENTSATHEWFKDFYAFYKLEKPDAYTVGEIYGAGAFIAATYQNQFDQVFNFELASGIMNSINGESNTGIKSAWVFTMQEITDGNYATFLTNHDQNRVMSVFNGNEEKAKLAAILLLTSPGTPYIYYGEEIGMQGKKPDEDIRLPMQWDGSANAGFTTGIPWRAPSADYSLINVAMQEDDPASLLNLYRALIKLRIEHPALRDGKLFVVETPNTGVSAILRSNGNENILVLVNLTNSAISDYSLTLKESILPNGNLQVASLLDSSQAQTAVVHNGIFSDYKPLAELPPYQAYIFQFK